MDWIHVDPVVVTSEQTTWVSISLLQILLNVMMSYS